MKRNVIASFGAVSFELWENAYKRRMYVIEKKAYSETDESVFVTYDVMEPDSYGQAARLYNSLVPDSECIPCF